MKKRNIKYFFIVTLVGLIFFSISYVLRSIDLGDFNLLFNFDINAPDLNGNGAKIYKEYVNNAFRNMDNLMTSTLYHFVFFAPFLATIGLIPFFNELTSGVLLYSFNRQNRNSILLKKTIINTIKSSIFAVIPIIIIIVTTFIFSESQYNSAPSYGILSSFTPTNWLFFYMQYLIIVFIFNIIYCLVAIGVVMISSKYILGLIVPTILFQILIYQIPEFLTKITGNVELVANLSSYNTLNSYGIEFNNIIPIFTPLIIPGLIGVSLIVCYFKRKDIC